MASVRKAIAAALPHYRSLTTDTPNIYLCDEVKAAAKAFHMAPIATGLAVVPYTSATTYSRVWEPKVKFGK